MSFDLMGRRPDKIVGPNRKISDPFINRQLFIDIRNGILDERFDIVLAQVVAEEIARAVDEILGI